jgi:hypothetical protein
MSSEVVIVPSDAIMPVITIDQAVARYKQTVEFTKKILVKDRDFGTIPGTERKDAEGHKIENNTLLKPGAEKLCTFFGLIADYQDAGSIIDFETGLFHFSYICILMRKPIREMIDGKLCITGAVAGTGLGSCNSRERKYFRGGKACPSCGVPAIKRSKYPPKDAAGKVIEGAQPGWYCHAKAGGCGANFAADDPLILEQAQVNDPAAAADLVNTIQKMAMKRALIAATLNATNASELFAGAEGAGEDEDEETSQNGEKQNGATSPPQIKPIAQEYADNLRKWIAWAGADEKLICRHYKIERLELLPQISYKDCENRLKQKHVDFMAMTPPPTDAPPSDAKPESPPAVTELEKLHISITKEFERIGLNQDSVSKHLNKFKVKKIADLSEGTSKLLLADLKKMSDAA